MTYVEACARWFCIGTDERRWTVESEAWCPRRPNTVHVPETERQQLERGIGNLERDLRSTAITEHRDAVLRTLDELRALLAAKG